LWLVFELDFEHALAHDIEPENAHEHAHGS